MAAATHADFHLADEDNAPRNRASKSMDLGECTHIFTDERSFEFSGVKTKDCIKLGCSLHDVTHRAVVKQSCLCRLQANPKIGKELELRRTE